MIAPDMVDLDLVRRCEQRIVNAWPAVDTLIMDGWVVRLANGYSGRANSASPIIPGATLDADLLIEFERLFAKAGLPPCIRLTPLCDPDAARLVERSGYRLRDASLGMIASVAPGALPDALKISDIADREWIHGVSELQEGPKHRDEAGLAAIVTHVRLRAAFATLVVNGVPSGFGMSVIERGMAELGSLQISPGLRGQGHGRVLVRGLMSWAVQQGAAQAYLQVDVKNAVAIRLYESLGFREVYRYRTMEKSA